jgi:hypothetical protein
MIPRRLTRRDLLSLAPAFALLFTARAQAQDSLASIARAYVQVVPGEADPGVARARLEAATGGSLAKSALRSAIRRDFARGDTVVLDGWVLSRSECRYCVMRAGEAWDPTRCRVRPPPNA